MAIKTSNHITHSSADKDYNQIMTEISVHTSSVIWKPFTSPSMGWNIWQTIWIYISISIHVRIKPKGNYGDCPKWHVKWTSSGKNINSIQVQITWHYAHNLEHYGEKHNKNWWNNECWNTTQTLLNRGHYIKL